MRVVVDTNVLVSGIFFAGTPWKVLTAWRFGLFTLVVSPSILDEYRRVASEMARSFPGVDITAILDLITVHAEIIEDRTLRQPVCRDPDDDKFLACAAAAARRSSAATRTHGAVDGTLGVRVLTPRAFMASLGR